MRSVRHFWVYFTAILLPAVFLRVYEITARPLHSDEAVNFSFVGQVERLGYYPYSHLNYHGPSLFYLMRLLMRWFGDSELALRSATILCGILLLPALLPLRKLLSDRFVLIAVLLMALSSSLVFYSRYAIHEMLLLLATEVFAVSIFVWLESNSRAALYWGMSALALMIATKETFVVGLVMTGLGIFTSFGFRRPLKQFDACTNHFVRAMGLALFLVLAIYTGGFQWGQGLNELGLALPSWIGRSNSEPGYFHPFSYYALMLSAAEPQLWLAFILPLVFFDKFRAADSRFLRFVTVWGVSGFLIYSFIPYKTPWLAINFILPLVFALAWWLSESFDAWPRGKTIGAVLLVSVAALSAKNAIRYNFEIPYGPENPYAHYNTSTEVTEVVKAVDGYLTTHPNARILIGFKNYWPFPYYLRHRAANIVYLDPPFDPERYAADYAVMILGDDVQWPHPHSTRRNFRINEIQNIALYLKN